MKVSLHPAQAVVKPPDYGKPLDHDGMVRLPNC
jgi:hypothetical protein